MIIVSSFKYPFVLQTFFNILMLYGVYSLNSTTESVTDDDSQNSIESSVTSTEDAFLSPSVYKDFYKLKLLYVTDRVIDDWEKRFEIISIAQKKYFNEIKTKLVVIAYETVIHKSEKDKIEFDYYDYLQNLTKLHKYYDFAVYVTSEEFTNERKHVEKEHCKPAYIKLSVGKNWDVETHALDLAIQMGYSDAYYELRLPQMDGCITKDIDYQFFANNFTSFCGNGVADKDEQCDYQTFGYRKNDSYIIHSQKACINCTLQGDAECLNEPCCNSTTFKILPAGTMCRLPIDIACGTAEYCDGLNKYCPTDLGRQLCRHEDKFPQKCHNNGKYNTAGSCDCFSGRSGQYCQYACPNCCWGSSHANFCYKDDSKIVASSDSEVEFAEYPFSGLLITWGLKLKFSSSSNTNDGNHFAMDKLKCNYLIGYPSTIVPEHSWWRVDMLDIRRVIRAVVYSLWHSDFDLRLQIDEMSPVINKCQTLNFNENGTYTGCIIFDYQCYSDARLLIIRTTNREISISEVEIYAKKKHNNQLPIIRKTEWIMEKREFCDQSCNESQLQDLQNETYSVAYLERIYYISYLKISTTSSSESVDDIDCEIKTSLFHERNEQLIGCDQSEVKRLDNGEYFVSCQSYGSLIIMTNKQLQYRLESVHGTKENIPISFYKNVYSQPSSIEIPDFVKGDIRLSPTKMNYQIEVNLFLNYNVESVIAYLDMTTSSTNKTDVVLQYVTAYVRNAENNSQKHCQSGSIENNNVNYQLLFSCNFYGKYVIMKVSPQHIELDVKQILVFGHQNKSLLDADKLSSTSFDTVDYHFLIDKQYNFQLNKSNCRRFDNNNDWAIHLNDVYKIQTVQIVSHPNETHPSLQMKFGQYWNTPLEFTKTLTVVIRTKLVRVTVEEIANYIVFLTSAPGFIMCELMIYGNKVEISALSKDWNLKRFTVELNSESTPNKQLNNMLTSHPNSMNYVWSSIRPNQIWTVEEVYLIFSQPVKIDEFLVLGTVNYPNGDNSTSICAQSTNKASTTYASMVNLQCRTAAHQFYFVFGTANRSKLNINITTQVVILQKNFSSLLAMAINSSLPMKSNSQLQKAFDGNFDCRHEYQGSIMFSKKELESVILVEYDFGRIYHLESVNVSLKVFGLSNSSRYNLQVIYNIKIDTGYEYTPFRQLVYGQYARFIKIEFSGSNLSSVVLCEITVLPVINKTKTNVALGKPILISDDNNNTYYNSIPINFITDGVSGNPNYYYQIDTNNILIDLKYYYDITEIIFIIYETNFTSSTNGLQNWTLSDLLDVQTGISKTELKTIDCNKSIFQQSNPNFHYKDCKSEGRYVKLFCKNNSTIKLVEMIVHGNKKTSLWTPWSKRTVKAKMTPTIQIAYYHRLCRIDEETLKNFIELCPAGLRFNITYIYNVSTFPKSQETFPANMTNNPPISSTNLDDTQTSSSSLILTIVNYINLTEVMHIDGIVYRHDATRGIEFLNFVLYKNRRDVNFTVNAVERIGNISTARCQLYATKIIIATIRAGDNYFLIENVLLYGFKAILCDAVIPNDGDISTPQLLTEENIYCDVKDPEKSWMILYQKFSTLSETYNWTAYKFGFEVTNTLGFDFYRGNDRNYTNLIDFYIGNDRIHNLSAMGYKLQIRLVFSVNQHSYHYSEHYTYDEFYLDNESNDYRISFKLPGFRKIIYGSRRILRVDWSFKDANGQKFSTIDRDTEKNCSTIFRSAGWFGQCIEEPDMTQLVFRQHRYYTYIYARFVRI